MTTNTETIKKVIELRNDRQIKNNKLAFDAVKENSKNPNVNHINKQALNRLLKCTNYKTLDELVKDKSNHEEIIMKIASLYIAKNSSRQGSFDEEFQLENINKLQDYDIIIKKILIIIMSIFFNCFFLNLIIFFCHLIKYFFFNF